MNFGLLILLASVKATENKIGGMSRTQGFWSSYQTESSWKQFCFCSTDSIQEKKWSEREDERE